MSARDDIQLTSPALNPPGSDRAAATAQRSQSGHGCSETSAASPHQLRRRRRNRLIALAIVLTAIFIGTLLWSRGTLEVSGNRQILAITPSVLFDQLCDEIKSGKLTKLHVTKFEVDDEMIAQIGEFEWIDAVILDKGVLTDDSMKTIAGLPNLQHLRLRLSPINDDGLKQLSVVESLWYLNLPHAQCTAEGVAALAALPRLRQLRLGSPNLGNDVTREIASITSLRGIHLIGVAVTDEGLKTLATMPHLESLYMDDSAVTEAGWQWLFREHPNLHVHIDQDHHDRDPKAHNHH